MIDIGYNFSKQSEKLEDVIAFTAEFFKKELTPKRIAARMNGYMRMEKIHLCAFASPAQTVGDAGRSRFFHFCGHGCLFQYWENPNARRGEPYIDWFDFYTSTPKMELCMCSWKIN
ncbi:MAG: hypothetical protein ACLRMZ_07035 [Blautia marasmi]